MARTRFCYIRYAVGDIVLPGYEGAVHAASCSAQKPRGQKLKPFLDDSQQEAEVLSLTACKKQVLLAAMGASGRLSFQPNLEVRLPPWLTP